MTPLEFKSTVSDCNLKVLLLTTKSLAVDKFGLQRSKPVGLLHPGGRSRLVSDGETVLD